MAKANFHPGPSCKSLTWQPCDKQVRFLSMPRPLASSPKLQPLETILSSKMCTVDEFKDRGLTRVRLYYVGST
jgi:hypothetical protein